MSREVYYFITNHFVMELCLTVIRVPPYDDHEPLCNGIVSHCDPWASLRWSRTTLYYNCISLWSVGLPTMIGDNNFENLDLLISNCRKNFWNISLTDKTELIDVLLVFYSKIAVIIINIFLYLTLSQNSKSFFTNNNYIIHVFELS